MERYLQIKRSAFVLLICTVINLGAIANTWHVGKNEKNTSIQSTIAKAKNGDTIVVFGGVYKEKNILIDKKIYLKGINNPILDGESKYEIISIKSNEVIIEGFKIINSGYSSLKDLGGIKIYDGKNIIVRNNSLINTFFGIYIQFGKHCKIENNTLIANRPDEQSSGNGIHCWKSDSLLIKGNTINGHRDGIYFEFVTHSEIIENKSFHNIRYGLHFMFSHFDKYISNNFKNNGAGVAVMYSNNVIMESNSFIENWGDASYGLLLKEISDSYIGKNSFIKNTIGIYMEGCSRVQIINNELLKNGWATKLQASCMNVSIIKNNFIDNSFDIGTNGTLVMNNLQNNYWDKYEGYDINRDKIGDIPYRPVSMFSMIIENNPTATLLFRSFFSMLLDKSEKIFPSITPENLKDDHPSLIKNIF